MNRRCFLKRTVVAAAGLAAMPSALPGEQVDDWLGLWEAHILGEEKTRYCDTENGEEIGWLMSPFLNGFYYGYAATGDAKWVARLTDWADSWLRRGVKEPDGFVGWPKNGTGGFQEKDLTTDSLLGEAMGLRPVVLMADKIHKDPRLKAQYGARAAAWMNVAEHVFEKWNSRGCWREVEKGGVWLVPDFGIDSKTGGWTEGYAQRATGGFTNPDNKQNHIARWMLAMHDATGKAVYRERAEKWFRLMKSRLKTREDGKFLVWNYWEPAGPWDYKPDGSTKHWVGVHPNGGYYHIDVEGMTAAFEHGMVFTREDIDRLVATNRDYMWNQKIEGAKFKSIGGGEPDPRWKDTPGVLWTPLVPYDETLRKIFLVNHHPDSWGGLTVTPWYLSLKR